MLLLVSQFMATMHTEPDGRRVMYVKGAPDRLMALCKAQVTGTGDVNQVAPLDPGFWQQSQAGLSSKGLRVLALCRYEGTAHIAVTPAGATQQSSSCQQS
jgi:magnesium-transporting ATPase (P-type)